MVEVESSSLFTARIPIEITLENVREIVGPSLDRTDHLPIEREKLEGKVAIITGSSRGIGAATARFFGENGMKVVVNSREKSREQGEQVAEDVTKAGGEAIWVGADVTIPEDAERLVFEAYNKFGRLDVVVQNVGTTDDGFIVRMKPNQWYDVLKTNAGSAFLVTHFAVDRMIKQEDPRGGNMVYVSSVGVKGLQGQANYAASKSAMEAVAVVTAREYARRNLYVSIIRPGFVETELTSRLSVRQKQSLIEMSTSKRPFKPEEIARGIAYLATVKEKNVVPIITIF